MKVVLTRIGDCDGGRYDRGCDRRLVEFLFFYVVWNVILVDCLDLREFAVILKARSSRA